ncbi:MAG: heme exporter protein CcmB, partial [Pseudomonadota bacterium]
MRRDLALALRLGGGGAIGLAFFVLVVLLVPLGVGREPATLARIAGGILWVAALLATLLSLDRLFQADHEDGTL